MTPREVSARIEDLVLWERTKLPADHPLRPTFGGSLIDKVSDDGQRAYAQQGASGELPTREQLEAMVNGKLDVAAHFARRGARERSAAR